MHISTPSPVSAQPRLMKMILLGLLLVALLPGCRGGSDDPVTPALKDQGQPPEPPGLTAETEYPASNPGATGGKALWGLWEVTLDREGGLDVVPLRGVEYALNVNMFLQPPVGDLANISLDVVSIEKLWIAGDAVVDVSLTHPFPSLTQFTGFDVMGVLIGTATYIANSDITAIYAQPDMDPILVNADGYTRWMNQMEFTTKGLLGYTDGALGNKNQFWNSTINPYKYFADGLYPTEAIVDHFSSAGAVSDRGMFGTGNTNTRRYVLHFPMVEGSPDVRFQYAIVASWVEPSNTPPLTIPGDFPAEANLQEAFHCDITTVGSTLYWNNMYDNGGSLFLTLEVFDWQGTGSPSGVAGEVKRIVLDSPDTFINGGNKLVFNPGDWTELAGTCANSVRLALDVGAVELRGPCPFDNDLLITIVTAEEGNYDNGLGGAYPTIPVLSGYARLFYDLGNVCNDPPNVWFTNCPSSPLRVANRTFRWEGEDDVTPNPELLYRYKLDSEDWCDWEENLKQAYLESMAEGEHTVYVECMDLDGQVTGVHCDFVIELPPEPQPPEVSFINCYPYVRSSTKTFNLDISDDFTPLSQIKVRYNYDGGGWVNLPDGSTSVTLTGLTSGGPHQLIVEVEDLDTQVPVQAQCDFDVNFRPTVLIDNCPPQDLNVNSYTFTWTGNDPEMDPMEFQTRLDMAAWSGWGTNTSLLVSGLASGNHVFRVRVRDSVVGTNQTQCNFKVNFAPSITITNKPSQDVNTVSYLFLWTASDDLDSPLTMDYNVELDGVWQGWQTGISSYNWTPLPSGMRTFRVRVRDTGNPALWAEDVCNFVVNFKPSVSIDNCPIGVWPSSDITFTWTGIDDNSPEAGMDYTYRLDSNPWSPWQLGQLSATYNGLSDADYTFEVKVRDTGTPVLYCDSPPDTCDTCNFTIDQSCAFPPPNVSNFNASDGNPALGAREVELTWDMLPGCVDFYDIERLDYNWGSAAWEWGLIQSEPHPSGTWLDTDARYSRTRNVIEYRISARNMSGSSPGFDADTGYPIVRNVKMALWCVADDDSGTNPATPWSRAVADFLDCNDFWNDYGVNFVSQNPGGFFWITNPDYRHLTGNEPTAMHFAYGRVSQPGVLNVYFVETRNGNYWGGACWIRCLPDDHNLDNVFIVLQRDTRGTPPNEYHSVLPHEAGHAVPRFYDEYLLAPPGATCANTNTMCLPSPPFLQLFCDDNAAYPRGGDPPTPINLMWFAYAGPPISDYNVYHTQSSWLDVWVHGYEANYPWP